jgi:F-type H+-transporting ATPase subunit b
MMRLRLSLLALPAALFLTPATAMAAAEGEPGLFSINLGLSVWTVVIFVSVFLLLARFAWKPILSAVEAREEKIQGALDEARKRQADAEDLLRQQKEGLAEARKQAQEILADTREAADRFRREMEGRAREESEIILARARAEIQREKEAALDALRRESVDLALAAASKLLGQKLDADEDRRLVMEYVDGLSNLGPGAEA